MRKLMVLIAITALALVLAAPGQAAARKRSETQPYTVASGAIVGSFGATWQLGNNWTTFKVRSGERKVSFSISDASGRPVLGHVHVNREDKRDFCGSPNKPIRVSPGDEIYVGAILGVCGNGEISGATTGTITATFTR